VRDLGEACQLAGFGELNAFFLDKYAAQVPRAGAELLASLAVVFARGQRLPFFFVRLALFLAGFFSGFLRQS
jgi:hypothetical protein